MTFLSGTMRKTGGWHLLLFLFAPENSRFLNVLNSAVSRTSIYLFSFFFSYFFFSFLLASWHSRDKRRVYTSVIVSRIPAHDTHIKRILQMSGVRTVWLMDVRGPSRSTSAPAVVAGHPTWWVMRIIFLVRDVVRHKWLPLNVCLYSCRWAYRSSMDIWNEI
jgi:hypothetical protein